MNQALVLVVQISISPDRDREFESFESAATRIMARYGGRMERRISFPDEEATACPDEVHVVTFPDRAAFESYAKDPELKQLTELRAEAIQ